MITGSLAGAFHGEPRATRDLDVVIDPDLDGLERLLAELQRGGYYVDRAAAQEAFRGRSQFNAIGPDATKVDLIVRKDRPFSVEEFGRRRRVDLLGSSAYIATAEDVILAKLEWAADSDSERQIRDVEGILAASADTLDRRYLERWVGVLGVAEAWDRLRSAS